MRKSIKEEILNRCTITQLNIDSEKAYIVNIEVGGMPTDMVRLFTRQVVAVFKDKLKFERCVFAPMVDGKEQFNIREITQAETDAVNKLYDVVHKIETPKSPE